MNHPRTPRTRTTRTTRRTTSPRTGSALLIALALLGAPALGACSSDTPDADRPEISVEGAYIPQPVTDKMAGGFMVVANEGGVADTLTSVTSEISDDVQLHKTVNERMQQVQSFTVPANGELKLSRGGNHLMFMNLKHKPMKGEEVPVVLHFATSDPIEVRIPVMATNHMPEK